MEPDQPTLEELRCHYITHLPYRSWCPHCIRGRGLSMPHFRSDDGADGMPTIGIDYCFMGDREHEAPGTLPILVGRDMRSKHTWSTCVPCKGSDAWVVTEMVKLLDHLGYKRINFKSDQEPAILDLKKKVKAEWAGEIVTEESPVADSQSNGGIERAVQSVEGQVRVMKDALEAKIGEKIPPTAKILAWLVKYSGFLLSCYEVGKDGRTAFERLKGKPMRKELVEFGEQVLYKKVMHKHLGKLTAKWGMGTFLGVREDSLEYLVGTDEGVLKARSIHREPEAARWNAEAVLGICGVPWRPVEDQGAGEQVPYEIIRAEPLIDQPMLPPRPRAPEVVPRRAYVTKQDMRTHGHTQGCPGCDSHRLGYKQRRAHTEGCLRRFAEQWAATQDGQQKVQRHAERVAIRGEQHAPQERDLPPQQLSQERDLKISQNRDDVEQPQPALLEQQPQRHRIRDIIGEWDRMQEAQHQAAAANADDGDTMMDDVAAAVPSASQAASSSQPTAMDTATEKRGRADMETEEEMMEQELEAGRSRIADVEQVQQLSSLLKGFNVSEVYSPPRIAPAASQWGFQPGVSMDLRTGWDFTKATHRNAAKKLLRDGQPALLIGSPVCTPFSRLQSLNKARTDPAVREKNLQEGIGHMKFCVELYNMQADKGGYFLHEHPEGAASWNLDFMQKLRRRTGIGEVTAHQCAFGLTSKDDLGEGLVLKPTRFLSNSAEVLQSLNRKCSNCQAGAVKHRHVHLLNGRAAAAAVYPPGLIAAVLEGISKQITKDYGVSLNTVEDTNRERENHVHEEPDLEKFPDANHDIEQGELDWDLVIEARKEELREFRRIGVWSIVPEAECWATTGRGPIGGRWVDVNKGDKNNPDYRSRYVAQEIKDYQDTDMFAPMPPLEAKKALFSLMASEKHKSGKPYNLGFLDIKKAYLYAAARRAVYVKLPPEEAVPGHCAKLNVSLYGTRDAARNWEETYTKALRGLGFIQGRACPCAFYNPVKDCRIIIHGDDFTVLGLDEDILWLQKELNNTFPTKLRGILGTSDQHQKEIRILNRVLRITTGGLEYEPDVRHVETIIQELGLQGSNGVNTPGTKQKFEEEPRYLDAEQATRYRGLVARANYVAQDRADIQFAVKELARSASSPTAESWAALKRLGRYLVSHPRAITKFDWQESMPGITVEADSDFAGCAATRKSTSGGVIRLGRHVIKTWSSTQSLIALSSGEAEYYALVKGACQGMGIKSLMLDLGYNLNINMKTDSSAAFGIAGRTGLGKTRHIQVNQLWVQEKVRSGDITLMRIPGIENPSDICTKHVDAQTLARCAAKLGLVFAEGRAASTPEGT